MGLLPLICRASPLAMANIARVAMKGMTRP